MSRFLLGITLINVNWNKTWFSNFCVLKIDFMSKFYYPESATYFVEKNYLFVSFHLYFMSYCK